MHDPHLSLMIDVMSTSSPSALDESLSSLSLFPVDKVFTLSASLSDDSLRIRPDSDVKKYLYDVVFVKLLISCSCNCGACGLWQL